MYKKQFFFIVFEGIEGTGKTFQINKLHNNLKKLKLNSIKTREPGGTETAEKIRKLIFSKNAGNFDELTDFYLMLASRNEHIKKKITKLKKTNSVLICDRFTDSTHCYQVIGKGVDNRINMINNNYLTKNIKPNLTFILKSNLKTIYSRIQNRKDNNKFDKLKKNFYNKVQSAFIKIAKKKKNYYVFDSSKSSSELEKKILNIVLQKITKIK